MFNLLKRKSEQQIVAEIHSEFDTAEDRLLEQADNLLRELNIDTEKSIEQKAQRLSSLGFTKSAPVEWIKNNSSVKIREQAELIKYYKQNYPFQKFLTEQELERICKKYNLVFAPVGNYIKDVPEKNIKEIETASQLKATDAAKDDIWCSMHYSGIINIGTIGAKRAGLPFTIKGKNFRNWADADRYLKQKYPHMSDRAYIVNSVTNYQTNKQGLFICAPQKHFDTRGLKKAGKYSFFNVTITEVKDPIVFRYCHGGVQVLSKWGLGASDEMLVNEINN